MTEEAKKLEEVQKEKQRLEEENKRLKEGQLIAQAKDFVVSHLKESNLPEVTKKRLSDSLSGKYVLNDKGEIDEAKFKEKIEEAVKEEVEYLSKVTGQGEVRDFGESGSGSKEPDTIQMWMDMGYSKELAESMAKGRN